MAEARQKSGGLRNEEGYLTIVAALVILTLISLIGFSSSRIAGTEVSLARNELVYKRNFYRAEGAVLEAADRLHHIADLRANPPRWMETITGALDEETLSSYWDHTAENGDPVVPEPARVDPEQARFLAGHEGVAPGASLDMSRPTIHAISIFGRCTGDGTSIIKMGFRAAY
ncbi:MAG: hypothetical protein WHT06_15650 [Desulfobacterales bacterium]